MAKNDIKIKKDGNGSKVAVDADSDEVKFGESLIREAHLKRYNQKKDLLKILNTKDNRK